MARYSVGYVLAPGFRVADVIGTQAVLGPHPLDRSYFLSHDLAPVTGTSGVALQPNATFSDCPELDVLVVGGLPEAALEDAELIEFLQKTIPHLRHVISVSGGVVAVARTGALAGRTVTADKAHLPELKTQGLDVSAGKGPVQDGKFITAGPSTGMIEAAYMVQRELRGEGFTKLLELNLEYDPVVQFPDPSGDAAQPAGPLKVAVVLPTGIYMPDVMGALDVLSALPGTEIYLVTDDMRPSKCLLGPTALPNCLYEDCPDVDVLVVGATSPGYLYDRRLLDFVRRQDRTARAMISVCAGTLVFAAAGLLMGRRATSNFHHTGLLKGFGAQPSHRPVERDGKYFSAGPAIGSYEIALQVVAELYGKQTAHEIEQDVLEYAPHPIYGIGAPEKAGKLLVTLSKAILSPSLPVYSIAAKLGRRRVAAA